MADLHVHQLLEFPVSARDTLIVDGLDGQQGVLRGPGVHFAESASFEARLTQSRSCLEVRVKRSRSCPASICALADGFFRNRRVRPHLPTREQLQSLDMQELVYVVRRLGLPKLVCREDRGIALKMLPSCSRRVELSSQRHDAAIGFFEHCSWDELLRNVRSLALRRSQIQTQDLKEVTLAEALNHPESPSWAYLAKVCNLLLQSQLRGQHCAGSLSGDGTLMAWHTNRVCKMNGLSVWWGEVFSRLGRGGTAVLVARQAPWVVDELWHISQLVPKCKVLPKLSCIRSCDVKWYLDGCDVLYIAGKYDRALSCLHRHSDMDVELAILNVCRSEMLATHLLAAGVRHVACWPADVHDRVAFHFGVSFVRFLFETSIEEAFARAKAAVSESERAPRLLGVTMSRKPVKFDRAPESKVVLQRHGYQTVQRRLSACWNSCIRLAPHCFEWMGEGCSSKWQAHLLASWTLEFCKAATL